MGASDIIAVILMLVGVALGAVVPPLLKMLQRRAALRLAGWVFPVISVDNEVPVIHLRASFDEILYGENPPTLRGYTHAGDVQAVVDIYKGFDKLPVKIQFDYFPEIDKFMKNVVIVGASSRSDISREIGRELYSRGTRVRGDRKHAYYRDGSGSEYSCEHQKIDGRHLVTKDVGLIYRKISELGTEILLCGGIHTFGSQAAAEVALLPEFQKKIRDRGLKQFLQFVTVDVIASGDRAGLGIVRQSIRWRDLPLEEI